MRRRVRVGEVGKPWGPALDSCLGTFSAAMKACGPTVIIVSFTTTLRPGEETMVADFGVQVVRPFEGAGESSLHRAPAGEVAMTTHIGSYGKLAAAHNANQFVARGGWPESACSWEIYGDWTDDEAKLESRSSICCFDAGFYRCAAEQILDLGCASVRTASGSDRIKDSTCPLRRSGFLGDVTLTKQTLDVIGAHHLELCRESNSSSLISPALLIEDAGQVPTAFTAALGNYGD